ncbi:MAG TPA: LytR C-terminal domain-containing protein [Nocardioides sp.]|nr:LytR C-terminal domain-containing protein [Nocardioides sp.]
MARRRGSSRCDERGLVMSSPVALLSAAAVVVAGAAFFATGGEPVRPEVAAPVTAAPSEPPPASTAPEPVIENKKKKPLEPPVRRGQVYVEVYNNSGISGLAGRTAGKVAGAGWQVVGSDNWYGTIPASTIYFPERLRAEARLLGRDLGIKRLKPAIAPSMRLDRLTVILTTDYRG